MSCAYRWVKEARGQMSGDTQNGARTKSAINNFKAWSYKWVYGRSGAGYRRRVPEPSTRSPWPPRYRRAIWRQSLAPQAVALAISISISIHFYIPIIFHWHLVLIFAIKQCQLSSTTVGCILHVVKINQRLVQYAHTYF